jgi:hypothetical protein
MCRPNVPVISKYCYTQQVSQLISQCRETPAIFPEIRQIESKLREPTWPRKERQQSRHAGNWLATKREYYAYFLADLGTGRAPIQRATWPLDPTAQPLRPDGEN